MHAAVHGWLLQCGCYHAFMKAHMGMSVKEFQLGILDSYAGNKKELHQHWNN